MRKWLHRCTPNASRLRDDQKSSYRRKLGHALKMSEAR